MIFASQRLWWAFILHRQTSKTFQFYCYLYWVFYKAEWIDCRPEVQYTCDSGIRVLFSGQAPSCVCCQVDKTMGFMVWWSWPTAHSEGSGSEKSMECRSMITGSIVMIWFQGTDTLMVWDWKGCLVNSRVTEPPPFTRMSNLCIPNTLLRWEWFKIEFALLWREFFSQNSKWFLLMKQLVYEIPVGIINPKLCCFILK